MGILRQCKGSYVCISHALNLSGILHRFGQAEWSVGDRSTVNLEKIRRKNFHFEDFKKATLSIEVVFNVFRLKVPQTDTY